MFSSLAQYNIIRPLHRNTGTQSNQNFCFLEKK